MSKYNCNCNKCGTDLYRKPSRLLKYKVQYCPVCEHGVNNCLYPNEEHQEWRDVFEFQGLLQVSNFGNVRTVERVRTDGRIEPGKILSQKIKKNDYLEVSLRYNKTRKWFLVHRLVASAFLTEIPETECVNHKNGNKKDNRVENLEFTTFKGNSNHAVRTGLCKNEEKHYKAKLTKENVIEIRSSSKTPEELSLQFAVSNGTIHCVRKRKTWKYVKE